MAIEHVIERLSPRRRAKLVRFLELATDSPLIDASLRTRAERHLRNIKSFLRKGQAVRHFNFDVP